MKSLLLCLGLFCIAPAFSQSNHTITIADATNDFDNTNENLGTEGGRTGYLTWDATNLYIGITGNPIVSTSSNLYVVIDLDPVVNGDSRGGSGRSDQPTSESGGATYPFNADVVYLFYGTGSDDGSIVNPASGLKYTVSSGTWGSASISSGVRERRHSTNISDFEIPFSDIGISSNANFNIIIYVANNTGGGSNFAHWPTTNTNGNAVTLKDFYSYKRTSGVTPNSSSNFCFRETIAGYTAAGTTFGRIYFVPSSSQTYDYGTSTSFKSVYVGSNATVAFSSSGTVNFSEDLYVDGTTTPRQSTLNFNGTTQTIGGSSGTLNIYGLTIANGSTTTVSRNITLVDFSNSYGTVTVTGTLNCGTSQFLSPGGSGSGTTVNINGTLSTSNSNGLSGTSSTTFQNTRISVSLGSASTIQYNATGAQTVTARTDYNNLSVSGSGTKTLAGTTSITGALDVSAGTFDMNAQSFILKSNSSGTARVAAILGAITNASNVTVQRYIPAKRAWRFLTAPLTGSSNNSIYYNWQNNGTTGSGVELWTTAANGGSATPSTANGLAAGTSNSILSYNNAWTAVTNSKTTNLFDATNSNAYCVFVSGPFQDGAGNISSGATATTLSATGTLRTTNTTISLGTLAADQYALVGNPFASPVDPTLLSGNNLKTSFWMWDPNLAGTYGVGGYVTFDRTSNQYNITTASYSNSPTSQIQSGQAFLVRASAAASTDILFEESDKSTTVNNAQFRAASSGFEQLRITLQKDFAGNNTFTNTDAVVGIFHASKGSRGIDTYDVSKLNNSAENIALVRSASNLTFEYHPIVTSNDTLFLNIWNTSVANYRLVIEPQDIAAMSGVTAILKDAYLNTQTTLSLTNTNTINFAVDANAASSGNRFMIVFTPPATLPVDFIVVRATMVDNRVKIDWSVTNEKNITDYVVERSTDGKSFNAIGNVKATTASQYSYIDASATSATVYYRIRSNDINGTTRYSSIVRVNSQKTDPALTIYPNPVVGRTFDASLNTATRGTYQLRLLNATGQQLLNKTFEHAGGTTTQKVSLANDVPAGVYRLQVQHDNEILVQSIIIR